MKDGDFVYIDFVGRVKGTGEVFDLTKEDVSKELNIHNPNINYKPVPIIIGGGYIIKGLDEALQQMNVGEKKTVEIPVEKAFGERKAELIKLLPLSTFKEQNIDPNPGSYITVNGVNGRVISNDGGRVRVDFNHPLAGKKLEYEVEIKEVVNDDVDKIKAIIDYYVIAEKSDFEVSLNNDIAEVEFKTKIDVPARVRENIANTVMKWIKLNSVRFVYEYSK